MYFKSDWHKQLYNQFLAKRDESYRDVYFKVFCYVAAATGKEQVGQVLVDNHRIDLEKLQEISGPYSSSEKALLELAIQLYNGNSLQGESPATITDICRSLDNQNQKVVVHALTLRYNIDGVVVSV